MKIDAFATFKFGLGFCFNGIGSVDESVINMFVG